MKYIFLANPTVGHTNFLISLALTTKAAGHDVMFMLPGIKSKFIRNVLDNSSFTIDEKLDKLSIPCKLMPVSLTQGILGASLPSKRGLEEVLHALKVFSAGAEKYSDFLIKEFTRQKPDAIIYDYTFFSAIAVAEKLNIPRVAVYHSGLPFLEYPIPPFGTTYTFGEYPKEEFNFYHENIMREEQTVKNIYEKIAKKPIITDFILSPNSSFLNIINTVKEAEYPRNFRSTNVLFTGPSFQGHSPQAEKPFFNKGTRKLIYVSLGTVFNKQPNLFIKIIKAIEPLEIDVLVSAGGSYKKLLSSSFKSNVRIEKFVPQQEVLKQTDVFITHGGKNSINESLKYGVPMVLFPAGGEQQYNANLVEYLNTGRNFGEIKDTFTAENMKHTIELLLNDEKIRKSIERLKQSHSMIDGATLAYQLINDKLLNYKD